jgi:hypothetical protein
MIFQDLRKTRHKRKKQSSSTRIRICPRIKFAVKRYKAAKTWLNTATALFSPMIERRASVLTKVFN